MNRVTLIYVKTRFEGMHYWAEAPEEVKFLRNPHRHLFYVIASFRVSHNDRQLEFFIIQKKLNDLVKCYTYDPNKEDSIRPFSCETLADLIFQYFRDLGYPITSVNVSEDDENGAVILKGTEIGDK